jgi:hypothetical protein
MFRLELETCGLQELRNATPALPGSVGVPDSVFTVGLYLHLGGTALDWWGGGPCQGMG